MKHDATVNYKLTAEAKADLNRIWQYGLEHYGEEQADKYYNAFFDRFAQLAEQPFLYPLIDHIRQGYRLSVCGVDSIY
jgi:toxin ParE1/3/4